MRPWQESRQEAVATHTGLAMARVGEGVRAHAHFEGKASRICYGTGVECRSRGETRYHH